MTAGLNKWGRISDDPNDSEEPDPWAEPSSIGDVNGVKYPADLIRNFHQRSDVDAATYSQHHTLGTGKNQAARGDHTHNGTDSKSLGFTWQTFAGSPTQMWGAVSAAPSVGNGFMTARYIKIGTLVTYTIAVVFGSTTGFGTGVWTFQLPFPAASPAGPATSFLAGDANGTLNSSTTVSGTTTSYNGSNSFMQVIDNYDRGLWSSTHPAWSTTNGGFSLSITYESVS